MDPVPYLRAHPGVVEKIGPEPLKRFGPCLDADGNMDLLGLGLLYV